MSSNPPNYFEDFDDQGNNDQLLEDDEYNDDETFGDSGPLTNDWENQKELSKEERDMFLQSNRIERVHREADYEDDDENDEEDDDQTFGNHHHHQSTGRNVNGFFSTTTTSTSSRKVTGVFNSLSLDDHDSTPIDEDSVFKIAMGESLPQQPTNPLLKLMHMVPTAVTADNNNETIKNTFSVSDLESKFIQSSPQPQPQPPQPSLNEEEQLMTPSKLNKNDNTATGSPKQQRYHKNKVSLTEMMGSTSPQQYQKKQSSSSPVNKHFKKQNSNNSPGINNNSTGDKKYMTAEEIQSIIRLQSYQIHFTNPYIEDYYYQRFRMKQSPSTVPTHTHTPICDAQPKQAPNKKPMTPNTVDPLSGALGRIPSHSIRAPRQILQIILNNGGGEEGNPDRQNQNSDQTIKLVIENSYNHVLDFEDINILIDLANSHIANNPQNQTIIDTNTALLQEYYQKRENISTVLFTSLHLDPFPSFKYESPQLPPQDANQKWPSVCPEDLLFVSLWVLAKGRKLLARAFPSLSDKQLPSGLFAVCRNLPLLLLLHKPEGSIESTQSIYNTVIKWIMEVPIKFFILGFHFLVNFNQGKFIVKMLTDSKEARSIIHAFLARGTHLHKNTLDPIDIEQWKDVFDRFFNRLTNNFITIFPPTNNPSVELTQLFNFIFVNTNEKQRHTIHLELSK